MIDFEMYMLRDKKTGRWHNWGGLQEWLFDSPRGGSIWFDKTDAQKFADEYPKHICDVEVVTLKVTTK